MDEADDLLQREKIQKMALAQKNQQQREQLIQSLTDQLVICLPHLPVIQEILFEHRKLVFDHYPTGPESIVKTLSGVGEYDCGGGFEYDKRLYQQSDIDDDSVVSLAWAISFENVFDKNVYLLPYKKYKVPSNGFACTIISKGEYKFFPHDVPRQYAIEWLAAYKRKDPNI